MRMDSPTLRILQKQYHFKDNGGQVLNAIYMTSACTISAKSNVLWVAC